MLPTRFQCPHCGTSLRGSAEVLGHRVTCQKCGQGFIASASAVMPASEILRAQPYLAPPQQGITASLPAAPAAMPSVGGSGALLYSSIAAIALLLLVTGAVTAYILSNQRPAPEQANGGQPAEPPLGSGGLDALPSGSDPNGPSPSGNGATDPGKPGKPKEPVAPPPDTIKPVSKPEPEPADVPPKAGPKAIDEYHTVLSEANQKKVNEAIDKGVRYLKGQQHDDGGWSPESLSKNKVKTIKHAHALGYTALPALTLLECGVPADDPCIQKAAEYVRTNSGPLLQTYDLSLVILFLDKLGDKRDKDLIRTLAGRLLAGQRTDGGWTYTCQVLSPGDEQELITYLDATRPELHYLGGDNKQTLVPISKQMLDTELFLLQGNKNKPAGQGTPEVSRLQDAPLEAVFKPFDVTKLNKNLQNLPIVKTTPPLKSTGRKTTLANAGTDNSNTQFAVMALWVARKHGIPVEKTMALVDQRFLSSQHGDGGWGYQYYVLGATTHTMTCVGLIGLAVGQGSHKESLGLAWKIATAKGAREDANIQAGLARLGSYIGDAPADWSASAPNQNFYFLWSVERVAMLYNLKTIGGKDWYSWAAHSLVVNQAPTGQWTTGNFVGSTPTINTCLALLVLRRANFVPDLTDSLKDFVPIRDPGK